ncbi:MAG: hypothetical protein ABI665_17315 [Vicinamibacterales bacterium]
MESTGREWLVVLAFAALTPLSAAAQSGTVLQSVQAVADGGMTLVIIQADGALPVPTHNFLDSPPRIYLDLSGVRPRIKGTPETAAGGAVTRARVGLYSANPDVTRVVLDLPRRETYRVDAEARHLGRIRILVGPESGRTPAAPAGISAPRLPAGSATPVAPPAAVPGAFVPPPPPSAPLASRSARQPMLTPQVSARPRLPASEIQRYRRQLSGALERMEAPRSIVVSIDADEEIPPPTLATAAEELKELRRTLEAIKPSDAVKPAHELLIASCTTGAVAVDLRIANANSANQKRGVIAASAAASAAAGSLMFFELACADLGCNRASR